MAGDEQLRHCASTVIRHDINSVNRKPIESSYDHVGLSAGAQILPRQWLAITQPHEVRHDATAMSRQPVKGAAPLVAIDWKAMEKERTWSIATIDISNPTHRKFCKSTFSRIRSSVGIAPSER